MFKKRSFQVKIVKDSDIEGEPVTQEEQNSKFADKCSIVNKMVKDNVKNGVLLGLGCVLAYVAADTARQCAVEVVKK